MSPKNVTGSGGCAKGSLRRSPRKPTRSSPRKSTKATTGATPKTIARQTSRKGKGRKNNATPPRSNKKRKTKTPNALPAVKEDDESSEHKVEDVIKKRPSPKATPDTIFNPAAKAGGDVRLFGQVLEPQKFKLGHIISIALHEEVYQDAKNRIKLGATREQTMTALGWVYSKNRKMVVISRFAQHLVGLPIFSHGGKGLEKKEKSEFVGIRDAQYFRGTPTDSKHPNLTSHRISPFIPANRKHWAVINEDSYVQFTRPLSFAYNTRCTIEGHLQDEDLLRLINLANGKRPTYSADPAARAAPRPR